MSLHFITRFRRISRTISDRDSHNRKTTEQIGACNGERLPPLTAHGLDVGQKLDHERRTISIIRICNRLGRLHFISDCSILYCYASVPHRRNKNKKRTKHFCAVSLTNSAGTRFDRDRKAPRETRQNCDQRGRVKPFRHYCAHADSFLIMKKRPNQPVVLTPIPRRSFLPLLHQSSTPLRSVQEPENRAPPHYFPPGNYVPCIGPERTALIPCERRKGGDGGRSSLTAGRAGSRRRGGRGDRRRRGARRP